MRSNTEGLLWNPDDFGYLSRRNDPQFITQLEAIIRHRVDTVRYRSFESLEQFRKLVHFNWICPACKRLAPHCMWNHQLNPAEWLFGFEEHHDHSKFNRFPRTLMCSMCNQRDRGLMQMLHLTGFFSLSPLEISDVVDHGQNNVQHSKITEAEVEKAYYFAVEWNMIKRY